MKNNNLYIMKQPALGKKIFDLRKQKGLTQEELVEKCNISVRTIQRIEAGETTPRSFTVKTILEALEADFNIDEFENEVVINNQDKRFLTTSWIFGIIYFVIGFIELIADVFPINDDIFFIDKTSYLVIKLLSTLSFTLFFLGFLKLSKLYGAKLLGIVVYVFIVLYGISELYDVLSIDASVDVLAVSVVIKSVVFGALQIVFGFSLLQLNNKLGMLIKVNAIFEIVVGVCLASIKLVYLGLVILVPTVIIEIIVLYRIANK